MRFLYPLLVTLATLLGVAALGALRVVGLYSHQAFVVVLALGLVWAVVSRAVLAWRGRLHTGSVRGGAMLLQVLGRGAFWAMLSVSAVAVFPRSAEMTGIIVGVAVMGVFRVVASRFPSREPSPGPSVVMALGAGMLAVDLLRGFLPAPTPTVLLQPPFAGDWLVLQGGASPMMSHHLSAFNQIFAVDLLKLEDGRILEAGAEGNAMSCSWEAQLLAPVSGTVVVARRDMADSEGMNLVSDPQDAAGNSVVIQSDSGQFVLLAHLRAGSVLVSEGQRVTAGEPIGKVGNSGNTTLSHLHLQVQTHADLWDPENRSLPFAFVGQGRVLRRNDRVRGGGEGG